MNHEVLDTTGDRCPLPIIRTKGAIGKLANGEVLLVIATDPSFDIDCRVFIRQSGHLLLQSWQEDQKFYFLVQKQTKATEAKC